MKKGIKITIYMLSIVSIIILVTLMLFVGSSIFKINGGFECVGVNNISNPLFGEVFKDLRDRHYKESLFGEKKGVFYTITNTYNNSQKKCIVIPGVYADSFQVLNKFYAKDKEHGYFENGRHMTNLYGPVALIDINSDSFNVFDEKSYYAKDKDNVYYSGIIIVGADSSTFVLIGSEGDALDCVESGDGGQLCTQKYDAKDKDHKYRRGENLNEIKKNDVKAKNIEISIKNLQKFKCEVLVKKDYEDNLIAAQKAGKSGDIDSAIRHLTWSLEKLEIQGDFLKKIEESSNDWQKTIDMITKNRIDSQVRGTKNDLTTIANYKIKDQKEAVYLLVSSLQTNRKSISSYFSNISCD